MKRGFAIVIFISVFLLIAGCVISPRRVVGGGSSGGSGGGGGTGSTGGQLYVATSNSILRFSNVEAATGNIVPTATITSSAISSPQHMTVDTVADRLYVANQATSSILIFDNASTLSGSATPRIISGNATHLSRPVDVAVDTTNNLLYVADGTSILVFSPASTVGGNAAPVRNINMGVTIGGLLLDVTNQQLYVSDPSDNAVDRLDSIGTQDVVGIVGGAIAGPDTLLSQPRGLALDSSGRLIVGNAATPISITIYPSASINTGDALPSANFNGGNTLLKSPQQIALNRNVSNGELYVADPVAASILIFTNISTATGNVAPARSITGSSTGLAANAINGLALDPTR
ncbi:MAG TPA: hypothetical protein VFB79_01085 [Candidatus Angelobacter sp.]|nr:hypothetical protein [Candidatus Angelobacter sp.]